MDTGKWLGALVWLAAAFAALVLHDNIRDPASMTGIVERVRADLGALEGGRLVSIEVELGEAVQEGQLLAQLDSEALRAELDLLRAQIEHTEALLEDGRTQEAQRVKSQGEALQAEALALREAVEAQSGSVAAAAAERARLQEEIERLESARAAGLGRASNLSALIRRRDVLARQLQGQRQTLATQHKRKGLAEASLKDWRRLDPQSAIRVGLAQVEERLAELKRREASLQARIAARALIAPISGRVTAIHATEGQVTAAFTPVISLEKPATAHVDLFISEIASRRVAVGDLVEVTSQGGHGLIQGHITDLDPGIEALPDRITGLDQPAWGRRARVRLEGDHGLLPGERVAVLRVEGGAP